MEVNRKNIDELNAVITVNVEKEDYQKQVEESLKDYRKKVKLDGFRPGKVPMGVVKKMYGKSVLIDEINKLISNELYNYINKENLKILGEPLASKDQKNIDFDNQENFEFKFDVGVKPEIEVSLDKRMKITYYKITADDKLIDEYIENYAKNFGTTVDVEVSDEESFISGKFVQLNENNEILEGGIVNDEAKLSVSLAKDEEIKSGLVGLKSGDTCEFDVLKAYPNDTEIAGLLNIDKEKVNEIENKNFRLTVDKIQAFKEADVDQELFDKAFGEGNVNSVEEFREKIKEQAEANFVQNSEYKFKIDAKDKLVSKIDPEIPDDFLKRWLKEKDNDIKEEDIEKEWDKYANDIKWQLISSQIAEDNDIDVTEEDLKNGAKAYLNAQFQQYGMSYIPDEQLEQYANEVLKKEEEKRKIADNQMENKIIQHIKDNVKVEEKEVSVDEFKELIKQ